MIHAKTEELKHIPWFAKAAAACSIVPISRFAGPSIFALKGGGYGCLFSLTGLDEEGLTDLELESCVRSIEGSLRGLPEGSCLYQYTRVMSGFDLPRQTHYANEVTETFANDRITFLKAKAGFRRIDLHWCLTIEPSQVKSLGRNPMENTIETSRLLFFLQKTAALLEGHLGSCIGLRQLSKEDSFQFFSYLFNLEEWAGNDQLRGDTGVDRQIVKNPIAWHSDHLQIGKRHVQMYSLKTTPEASRPCLFSSLLTLDCDSVLCTTWRVKSTSAARSEIDSQEKFISFFKVGVLQRVMSGRDTTSLDTGAGAKAANRNVDDLSEVIGSLDKKAQGEFSLRLLLAARGPEQLREVTPVVHRVFVDARAQVVEETLGNLSAFYAMFPGNQRFNVFPMWLSEDHHARLSSVFAPHTGHPHSDDLDSEYLNIFETRTRTPFFQDVYVGGVRVMLIIGPTGTGKTSTLAAIRQGAEQNGYVVEGFAPTSRAAHQLRDSGVTADTLQAYLARAVRSNDPSRKHLYMVDESSLASTKQMRDFLRKLGRDDKVLLIGDVRQHQGVDVGKPFEQLQESGMRSALLDRIVRQKDPELLRAVEHLSKNEVEAGIRLLQNQGRVTEIPDAERRITAIAKNYATHPESTIIVSPDNASRRDLNQAVRQELRTLGLLETDDHSFKIFTPRSEMTGADRAWAARYEVGDVLHYIRGSKEQGIEAGSYAQVVETSPKDNLITVLRADGVHATYDPSRLRGISAYREIEREFAIGDRVQLTAPNRDLQVANRDLGTLREVSTEGRMTLRMDSGRDVSFSPREMRHFDHGYAVTSHSSQGLTSERVLVNMDTDVHPELINGRFAYVSVSRASHDAQVFTNDAAKLAESLSRDVSKTSALDLGKVQATVPNLAPEQPAFMKKISEAALGLSL
jgi:AAA domain/CagE, TrbE, VirB family, component of type IV transporter system